MRSAHQIKESENSGATCPFLVNMACDACGI
ncbi:hypothetical protein H9K75_06620 [Diaphorobacter aerolatus]|uniref:Uncharacterized protein n=1 Tax=Diaphorobacter aerolatus TaxID=1288495 RepID=A0A7H0GQ70_9BURK|nr:hypothetical protein H9K75_06620 [Diaphorobacter aerolatus]